MRKRRAQHSKRGYPRILQIPQCRNATARGWRQPLGAFRPVVVERPDRESDHEATGVALEEVDPPASSHDGVLGENSDPKRRPFEDHPQRSLSDALSYEVRRKPISEHREHQRLALPPGLRLATQLLIESLQDVFPNKHQAGIVDRQRRVASLLLGECQKRLLIHAQVVSAIRAAVHTAELAQADQVQFEVGQSLFGEAR